MPFCYSDRMHRLLRGLVPAVLLSAWISAAAFGGNASGLHCEVVSLGRPDLPDDFPLQALEVGFAVLDVHCTNRSSVDARIEPSEIVVMNSKRKRLKQAEATDVTPKVIKYYRRSGGVHPHAYGEVRARDPYPPDPNRARIEATQPTVGIPGNAGRIDAGLGTALRQTLEAYRLKPTLLQPEGRIHGFLYLQSKKHGRELSGGSILVNDMEFRF